VLALLFKARGHYRRELHLAQGLTGQSIPADPAYTEKDSSDSTDLLGSEQQNT